ncbi:MAG: hypothetical protein Q4F17_09415 [Eubacteriales bacterium]|nr:hypothetical protein [Eubacteriales bacterium]
MFALRHDWLMVPQSLYFALRFGGAALAMLALGLVIFGLFRKKSRRFCVSWVLVLAVSAVIYRLTAVGVIIGHLMIGGM